MIRKKREGGELTKDEIDAFVKDVSSKKYVTEAQIGKRSVCWALAFFRIHSNVWCNNGKSLFSFSISS